MRLHLLPVRQVRRYFVMLFQVFSGVDHLSVSVSSTRQLASVALRHGSMSP